MLFSLWRFIKSLDYFAVGLTILVSWNTVGFLPAIPSYMPISFALISLIYVLMHGKYHIESASQAFLLYLPITIILAQPDPVFRSWARLISYASLFLLASPFFQSQYMRKFRHSSLIVCCIFCIFIGIGSFIAYFLGYSAQAYRAMDEGVDVSVYDVGRFSGIASHSMSLGPIAGIGAIVCVYLALVYNKRFMYLLALPCLASMLFAASRGAFIATLSGILFIIYKFSSSKSKFIKHSISIVIVAVLTFPIWGSALSGLQTKHSSHADDTEIFDSRSTKFKARFMEIQSSPIWGVGFSAIDPKCGDNYHRTRGTIEPGSSWLAILSMTGIIGLFLFIRMCKHSLRSLRRSDSQLSMLLISVFVLLSVHMLVEGYIFASGNTLCYYVSLVIGCMYDMKYQNKLT